VRIIIVNRNLGQTYIILVKPA